MPIRPPTGPFYPRGPENRELHVLHVNTDRMYILRHSSLFFLTPSYRGDSTLSNDLLILTFRPREVGPKFYISFDFDLIQLYVC